jgi:Tat protein secretion system quality control protein TatD with DNase activity
LVETDSPVLSPAPGTRNVPANLPTAIDAVAKIKEIHVQEVVAQVAENTRRLYGDLVNTGGHHRS